MKKYLITLLLLSHHANSSVCNFKKKILLTAFEGFPSDTAKYKTKTGFRNLHHYEVSKPEYNNSLKTLDQLEKQYSKNPELLGSCIEPVFCKPVPVIHNKASDFVEECIKRLNPDDIYLLGQGKCESINFEQIGNNKLQFKDITDNAGFYPDPNPQKIDPNGPEFVKSSLPLAELQCASLSVKKSSSTVNTTFNATETSFICNETFFKLEYSKKSALENALQKSIRIGFVHIPSSTCLNNIGPKKLANQLAVILKNAYTAETQSSTCTAPDTIPSNNQPSSKMTDTFLPHEE